MRAVGFLRLSSAARSKTGSGTSALSRGCERLTVRRFHVGLRPQGDHSRVWERQGRRVAARRRRPTAPAAATSAPFPFAEDDYYRAMLQMVQGNEEVAAGFLLFLRPGLARPEDKGLVVLVGGDSLQALLLLQQGASAPRPLTVELLWEVLQRGQSLSSQAWTTLRVAIVDMADTAFIGRLWFGCRETGESVYDVDIRPSDAVWLAIKSNAPIYIHRRVWDAQAVPLAVLADKAQRQAMALLDELGPEDVGAGPGGEGGAAAEMTTPRAGDPEPLKRLKMELRVALAEENYAEAARIRDHPFSKLHFAAVTALQEGDTEAAKRYRTQLAEEIAAAESAAEEKQEDRPGA